YTETYSGLQGTVTQSHIHVGQLGVNGSIVIFLCQTAANPDPTGLAPQCPHQGTVSGTITTANVIAGAMAPSSSWLVTSPRWSPPSGRGRPTPTSTRRPRRAGRSAASSASSPNKRVPASHARHAIGPWWRRLTPPRAPQDSWG